MGVKKVGIIYAHPPTPAVHPPKFSTACPGLPASIAESYIRSRICTYCILVARGLYNMRVKRRRQHKQRSRSTSPSSFFAIARALHHPSVFALPCGRSSTTKPIRSSSSLRFLTPSPALLLPSHLHCRDSSRLLEFTGSQTLVTWMFECVIRLHLTD